MLRPQALTPLQCLLASRPASRIGARETRALAAAAVLQSLSVDTTQLRRNLLWLLLRALTLSGVERRECVPMRRRQAHGRFRSCSAMPGPHGAPLAVARRPRAVRPTTLSHRSRHSTRATSAASAVRAGDGLSSSSARSAMAPCAAASRRVRATPDAAATAATAASTSPGASNLRSMSASSAGKRPAA